MWSSMNTNQSSSNEQFFINVTSDGVDSSYCRNPDNDHQGPWCYVKTSRKQISSSSSSSSSPSDKTNTKKQYCGIPVCGISDYLNNLYINNPQNTITKTSAWDSAYIIQLISYPIIIASGTILNSFSFIVFRRPSLKKSTTSFLLTMLACSDTATLYIALLTRWLRILTGLLLETSSLLSCRVYFYISFIFTSMSNYILVFITIERLIAVTKPHKAQLLCTKKNAGIAVVSIFILMCLACIPLLVGMEPRYYFIFGSDDVNFGFYGECVYCCAMNLTFVKLVVAVNINMIPFFSILFGNITILVSLSRNRLTRRAVVSQSKAQSDNTQLQSITTTLLIVSFSYLILTFPLNVYSIVYPTIAHLYDSFSEYWCSRILWFTCSVVVLTTNYSANFILYCIGGKRFRKEFITMIGCTEFATSKPAGSAARKREENPQPGTSQSQI